MEVELEINLLSAHWRQIAVPVMKETQCDLHSTHNGNQGPHYAIVTMS